MSCSAQGVHFVGSLPVDNIESAFTTVATTLPQHVLRCPDGEPGERANFTAFQYFKFPEAMRKPFIPDTTSAASDHNILSDTEVRDQLKDLVTEYDRVAISSYAIFTRLKEDGTIPKHIKFQVCFPTPTCVISGVRRPYQPLAEELYRSALLRALQNVQDHIPHHELAIQIDCAIDFAILEHADFYGRRWAAPWWSGDIFAGIVDRILAFAKGTIANDVDTGFHFCYGDSGHKHFVEPRDLGTMCDVLRVVWKELGRDVQWVHVPVPRNRGGVGDETYYEALEGVAELLRERKTTVYLGLVHAWDEEGTRMRVETAAKVMKKVDGVGWGIATECGLGRMAKGDFQSILKITKGVSGVVV